MMRIDLKDPRVNQAVELVKQTHNVPLGRAFEEIFEQKYHCRIIIDPADFFCTSGHLVISEEKYQNWFILQFGVGNDEPI